MINVLWIGENPKTTSTSSLMGWPICKELSQQDFIITYLAVGILAPPYKIDNINVIHPIIQDQQAPYGLGSVQNMFITIFKRVSPDVVVICLDRMKTKEMLFQLRNVGYKNIIVWALTNDFYKEIYDDIKIIHSLNWKAFDISVIRPVVNTDLLSSTEDCLIYIDRDNKRFELLELLSRWRTSEHHANKMILVLDYIKNVVRPELILSEASDERVIYHQFLDQGVVTQGRRENFNAKYFCLHSLKDIKTIGAIECLSSGLRPALYNENISDFEFGTTEFDFLRNNRDGSITFDALFCNNKSIEKWVSLLDTYRETSLSKRRATMGINFKGHIWGNGSMSLTTRLLASAMDSIEVDVSLENTTLKQSDQCVLIQDKKDLDKLVQLEKKKIDPNQFAHIRYSGPQSSEHHLIEGLFDYTIGQKNIAYWSIDYSALGGPGCPSADLFNEIPDQVWVPSSHSKMALVNSGVKEEKVKIVPNGYFDDIFTVNEEITKENDIFVFLNVSNFKFFLRKGIDVLLESYIKTFDIDDKVKLLLQSQSSENIVHINELIGMFTKQYHHNPNIEIQVQPLSQYELSDVYRSCDCFVFPSRGESFGLPPLEAMACKKAVIITNWGGMTDFCNPENSYLIDYDLEPVKTWQLQGWGGGLQANPKIDCLAELMLHVFRNSTEREEKAIKAHLDAKDWTWTKAAYKAKELINQL